jgi:hypothetical protein
MGGIETAIACTPAHVVDVCCVLVFVLAQVKGPMLSMETMVKRSGAISTSGRCRWCRARTLRAVALPPAGTA